MALRIFVLVIACAAVAAGFGYVRIARRMRSFRTAQGQVIGRVVVVVPSSSGEGRWGSGGRYGPKVTYSYLVDGVTHTSDRWGYASNGRKRSVAERQLAAVPDAVTVFYDPDDPDQAYLHTHSPRLGYVLLIAGGFTAIAALVALLS